MHAGVHAGHKGIVGRQSRIGSAGAAVGSREHDGARVARGDVAECVLGGHGDRETGASHRSGLSDNGKAGRGCWRHAHQGGPVDAAHRILGGEPLIADRHELHGAAKRVHALVTGNKRVIRRQRHLRAGVVGGKMNGAGVRRHHVVELVFHRHRGRKGRARNAGRRALDRKLDGGRGCHGDRDSTSDGTADRIRGGDRLNAGRDQRGAWLKTCTPLSAAVKV